MWKRELVAVLLAASALLAGCAARSSVVLPPSRYVVCQAAAVGCNYGAAMVTEPKTMALSADGSLYVEDVTWQGWGTDRAVGTGTAEADNCRPNCAQGSYSKHPATIILTDLKPWHGKFAYSRETDNVPALGWHHIFTQGLIPGTAST